MSMPSWLATCLLVVTRIGALTAVVPGLHNRFVPWRIRLVFVCLVTLPVLCVISPIDGAFVPSSRFFSLLIQEAAFGISLSLVPAILFFGLQLATESLQGMTGLPGMSNESAEGGSGITRLFFLVALTTFFATSGHRVLFQTLLDSFRWMPVGTGASLASTKEILLNVFSQSFQLGVRAVAPIAASLAIGLCAVAAANRVIPQLSYFAVGMSVQTTILFASLVFFLGCIGMYLESGFEVAIDGWQANWLATAKGVVAP